MTPADTRDVGIADRVARDAVEALSTFWDQWSRVSEPVWERTGRLGAAVHEAVLDEAKGSVFASSIRAEIEALRSAPLERGTRARLVQLIRHMLAQSTAPAPGLQAAVETFVRRNRIVQHIGAAYNSGTRLCPPDPGALLTRLAPKPQGLHGSWLCTVVVHFRASSALRGRNAIASVCAVLDQTLPRSEFRVVVVEQDSDPLHADILTPSVDQYIFAPNQGEYNRSWGRNVGAVATRGQDEYLCFVDADLLLPQDFLEGCLAILRDSQDVGLLPQASLCYLDDVSSDLAIQTRLSTPQRAVDLTVSRAYRLMTNRGGCIFVASHEFHAANGYDERYEGWGDEDNEFFERLGSRGSIGQLAHDVVHLHHERPREVTPGGARPNEWLVGLEPDSLAVIGDVRRYSTTSISMED